MQGRTAYTLTTARRRGSLEGGLGTETRDSRALGKTTTGKLTSGMELAPVIFILWLALFLWQSGSGTHSFGFLVTAQVWTSEMSAGWPGAAAALETGLVCSGKTTPARGTAIVTVGSNNPRCSMRLQTGRPHAS